MKLSVLRCQTKRKYRAAVLLRWCVRDYEAAASQLERASSSQISQPYRSQSHPVKKSILPLRQKEREEKKNKLKPEPRDKGGRRQVWTG